MHLKPLIWKPDPAKPYRQHCNVLLGRFDIILNSQNIWVLSNDMEVIGERRRIKSIKAMADRAYRRAVIEANPALDLWIKFQNAFPRPEGTSCHPAGLS